MFFTAKGVNSLGNVRVLIVDDHHMFLRGIRSIIMDDETIEIVGEAHNGKEAYVKAKETKPDVILMDVNMPVCDGIEALRLIKADIPETNVLMLTVNEKDENLFEALKLGAVGYLLKNVLANELITFIHMASRGESAITGPMASKIVQFFSDKELKKTASIKRITSDVLTRREKEILQQVIKGLKNREIAEVLFISENTVKNHLRNIMEKLHMNNRAQVAAYALKEGWLNKD